ncbi:hypothetical protein SCP_0311150 [Sparassis crispa]|uniref:F-box domain-containing protein n=1 Tax=Sparassis crispa TaxID=139825 RepID=A0A401GGR6_9APHY|nr:hypothetical protein SCP_0311150 [Sparassis crispa]GBE81386.1 hypothetical protein SCP_0311150 [Sparassis crispa]
MEANSALSSYDILPQIFCHLSPTKGRSEFADSVTLASCARVSKAFSDNALDVLWEDLDHLYPLLQLFSSFVPGDDSPPDSLDDGDEPERNSDSLVGDITPEEWARFRQYARRVRTLNYSGGSSQAVHDITSYHRTHFGDQALLPSLHEFYWQASYALDMNVQFLFSQSLRLVSIVFLNTCKLRDRDIKLQEIIDRLSQRAPLLQEFRIRDLARPIALTPLVTRCSHLRNLAVIGPPQMLHCQFLEAVSALESLEELWIRCDMMQRVSPTPVALSTLSYLRLEGKLGNIVAFLGALVAPNIRTLKLTNHEHTSSFNDHVQLMTMVHKVCSASLRRISYHSYYSQPALDGSHTLLHLFRPLLQIHDLQDVALMFRDGTLGLSDRDVYDIASAWQELQCLTLRTSESRLGPHIPVGSLLPTLGALACFARFCPQLVQLELPFIADLTPSSNDEIRGVVSHSLRKLDIFCICDPGIKDPSQVAQFIDSTFPNLDLPRSFQMIASSYRRVGEFESDARQSFTKHKDWDAVALLLQELQSAREQ